MRGFYKRNNAIKIIFFLSRDEALNNMKIMIDVRKCMLDIISKIEKTAKEEQAAQNQPAPKKT